MPLPLSSHDNINSKLDLYLFSAAMIYIQKASTTTKTPKYVKTMISSNIER